MTRNSRELSLRIETLTIVSARTLPHDRYSHAGIEYPDIHEFPI